MIHWCSSNPWCCIAVPVAAPTVGGNRSASAVDVGDVPVTEADQMVNRQGHAGIVGVRTTLTAGGSDSGYTASS
jgi:hypothetical protein